MLAEFRHGADQPLWFSESRQLMDSGGIGVDGTAESEGRRVQTGVGLYTSFTTRDGNNVLWHPDRKFFLLGKNISARTALWRVPCEERSGVLLSTLNS